MDNSLTETFIVAVKRALKGTVTLPDIFQQAGITGMTFTRDDMGRFNLTQDQRKALERFSDRIHIENPIKHC